MCGQARFVKQRTNETTGPERAAGGGNALDIACPRVCFRLCVGGVGEGGICCFRLFHHI